MARATSQFSLHLFGAFRLERGGRIIHLPTRKFESLLAYLAFFPECHAREKIAALFWGDSTDARARASLRNALNVIRKSLADDVLIADRENVQINPSARLTVDAHEFQKALTAHLNVADFKTTEFTQNQIDELESALALYQGDLLNDFYDEWIAPERERLRAVYLDALLKLAQWLRSRSQYVRAIDFVRRALELEPTSEKAHQNLIFCHIAAGDRSAALRQYEECERRLREELNVEPLPETRSLYQWIVKTETRARTPEAQLTNLPMPLTEFIGRTRECEQLKHLLEQKRLVTLTGAGGCGKTRLAIQVAGAMIDQFKDGVWWIGLASVEPGAPLPQLIAGALGVTEVAERTLFDLLISYLERKRILLLFDGCEYHIAECAERAQALLNACPQLTLLTTGRESLNVAGETVCQITPLEIAPGNYRAASPQAIAELLRYDAVRLFVQRAALIKPDFGLNEKNAPAVAEICRRLDGIPLALELAAARVKALTVAQIAERLNDRFHLLTAGSRTALPHHQTLKAAMDWSYDSLTDAERIVFRRLSVFLSSWNIEAAEQVVSDALLDGTCLTIAISDVLDLLTRLVTKSLVVVDTFGDDLRYRMLETVREYAREKLIESGEALLLRARHRDWFVQFAANAELKLRRNEQLLWLSRLDADHENLRAALRWSLRREDVTDADIEKGMRLTGALTEFWAMRGLFSEGRKWMQSAIAHGARLVSDKNNLTRERARAHTLIGAGVLAYLQGDLLPAQEFCAQGYALALAIDDQWLAAIALFVLAEFESRCNCNFARARELNDAGLAFARAAGDEWLSAVLLMSEGFQARLSNDHARAVVCFEEGLRCAEHIGDLWVASGLLDGLGDEACWSGDYARAQNFYERGLAARRLLKDKSGIAGLLNDLGQVASSRGDLAHALDLFNESLALWQGLDQRESVALVQSNVAWLALKQGRLQDAADLFRASLATLRALGNRAGMIGALAGVASVAARREQFEPAARWFGAVNALQGASGGAVLPADAIEWQATAAMVRQKFGAPNFEPAFLRGQAMSMEQAIADALALNT